MKKNEITIASVQFDAATEEKIRKRDAELKELAISNAKHFAKRNLPNAVGDNLAHYTDELKAGYEKLSADIFHQLQPNANFPEAKIDADFFKEKDGNLDAEINSREHQNNNDERELGNFNPGIIHTRILWAIISTLIISIGEILFNTKAFQVTGENMLFALILSIAISFAVFIFSHIAPFMYKAAPNRLQRFLVIAGSLFIVTGLFTALAILRSTYLASHDVKIQPFYFVIINLFFFIVSSLLSLFVLPSWQEIKENAVRLKQYYAIRKRKKEIERLKKEKEAIREIIARRTKDRIRIVHSANYSAERFRKMFKETLAIFKRTNLAYRTDGLTPSCFSDTFIEADIQDVELNILPSNRKIQ